MTSTRKGGGGVLKFFTCLRILLFLNNRSIVRYCGWWGVGGSKTWSFFMDVINGWPLILKYFCKIDEEKLLIELTFSKVSGRQLATLRIKVLHHKRFHENLAKHFRVVLHRTSPSDYFHWHKPQTNIKQSISTTNTLIEHGLGWTNKQKRVT